MSVSGGGGDLDLIINGGEAFVTRLAELRTATEAYTKSLNDLALGKEALAVRDEAARALTEAKSQRDIAMAALDKELKDAHDNLSAWVEKTNAATLADRNAAAAALDEAKVQQEAALNANNAASSALQKAQISADTLVKDASAQAAQMVADAQAKANKITAEAASTKSKVDAAVAEAAAIKAKYKEALARFESAVVAD